jgi:hypothetical protein
MFFSVPMPVLNDYYGSLFPFLPHKNAIFLHIVFHYLPLLWTGIDFGLMDAFISLFSLWVWYSLVRNKIKKIYTNRVPIRKYDFNVLASSMIYVFVVLVISLCSCGHA